MNPREKKLATIIVSIVGAALVLYIGRSVFLKPLRVLDTETRALQERLEKIKGERRAYFAAEDSLKKITQRTFADHIDEASAKSGALLTSQLLTSGLKEGDFSRLPVGPRKLKGALEIGWSVQGEGSLDQIVNLLFLLEKSPHLHRVDGVSVSPADRGTQVKVRFRYLTLVIDPAPIVDPAPLKPGPTLESPDRALYQAIVQRDILRPFIPPAPPPAVTPGTTPLPPAAPGPEALQVVSLSEWKGKPEIHVRDSTHEKTLRFSPGDALAGGTVVMIDYRTLPRHGREHLRSDSRVIIKIGAEFWAIDRGQTVADKYRLKPEQLPEQLSKL